MKRLLLSLSFLLTIAYTGIAQHEDCAGAEANPEYTTPCTDTGIASGTTDSGFFGTGGSEFDPSCDIPGDTYVFDFWYKINATSEDLSVTLDNYSEDLMIVVLELGGGLCASPNAAQEIGCLESTVALAGTPLEIPGCLTIGQDYYIVVLSTTGSGSTFDICIDHATPLAGIPNDDCATPDGTLVSGGPAVNGTNQCASADPNGFCALEDEHTVYYEYTPIGPGNVDLSITVDGDGTNSDPITSATIGVFSDCLGTDPIGDGSNVACSATLGVPFDVGCLASGNTYIIAVGSADGNDGDFTISIVETIVSPSNDLCTSPTVISTNGTLVGESNICADGESVFCTLDGSTSHDVYYQYTLTEPSDITISVSANGSNGTPIIGASVGIFENCGLTPVDATDPTIGVECALGTDIEVSCLGAGTYIIVVGSEDAQEGDFDISVTELGSAADNDLCIDNESLNAGNGYTLTGETTICTTPDFAPTCAGGATINTVWYEYVVNPNVKTLSINILNYTGTGDVYLAALTDCGSGILYDANSQYCGSAGTDLIEIDCPVSGDIIKIFVGSEEGMEGDFDISLTETFTTAVNDLCAMATDATPANACIMFTTPGDNTGACPEVFDPFNCGLDDEEVVWFSVDLNTFTGTVTDMDVSVTNNAAPFWQVFSDCNGTDISGCFSGTAEQNIDLTTASGTIFIAVGTTGDDGSTFDLNVQVNTTPSNDDPCDPVPVLTDGTPTSGTTLCASDETPPFISPCDPSWQTNTVFYEITVNPGQKGFNLTINSSGANPLNPADNVVAAVFENDACANPGGNFISDVCFRPPDGTQTEFECVGPGTYIIRISTSDTEAGDFEIIVDLLDLVHSNDVCDDPVQIDINPICEWIPVNANTEGDCPESFDFASDCGFDDFPVVWYSFQAPAGATELQVNMITSSAGVPFYGVFEEGIDCGALTAISNCEGPGMNATTINITEFNTYLIGVGADVLGGANSIDFEIKVLVPPANDDPCFAEIIPAGTASGTTTCATEDFNEPFCQANNQEESSVWFEYTLQPGEIGIEVSIVNTSGPGTGPFNVNIFELPAGCAGMPVLVDDDVHTCDGENEPLTVTCLDPNSVVYIFVSTASDQTGDFDLTVAPVIPDPACVDNDVCDNAEDLGTIVTDEDCTQMNDCNENACPDIIGNCNGGMEVNNVVWYTVSNDGNGEFISVEVLGAEFNTPVIAVFTGTDCNNLTQIGNCEEGAAGAANTGPIEIDPVNPPMAGDMYWIAIGSVEPEGGNFTYCIEINSGCVNDEPCDAVVLTENTVVTNPASTSNCTEDFTFNGCDPDLDDNSVWYTFNLPPGFSGVDISINNVSIVSNINVQVGQTNPADCSTPFAPQQNHVFCETNANFSERIVCLEEDTEYYIHIGSATGMDAGDFEIVVDFLTPAELGAPDNDPCTAAEIIGQFQECEYVDFMGTTENACPDNLTSGACDYTDVNGVWYRLEIPGNFMNVDNLDIQVEGSAGQLENPMFTVMTGDCATGFTAVPGGGCLMATNNLAEIEDIDVNPNDVLYVLIASETGDDGEFTIRVKLDVPPENDLCENAEELIPNGSTTGTTSCATNTPGTVNFSNCADVLNEADVWYAIPIDNTQGAAIMITISGWTSPSVNFGAEVYLSGGGCQLEPVPASLEGPQVDCSSDDKEFLININCLDPAVTHLYVKVGSQQEDPTTNQDEEGDFVISAEYVQPACEYADTCDEITDAQLLGPTETDPNFATFNIICVESCLDLACPEDPLPPGADCGFSQNPTVWYQIETDDIAAQLFTYITTPGTWTPVWSVYFGDDCNNLTQIATGSTPPCSNGDETPDLHQTAVEEDINGNTITTYYLAITADGEIDDPTFELCAYTTINAIVCLGDIDDNCEPDPSLVMEVTDRSNGGDLNGPFCPGEEVTINLSFFYDATESGADWLIGFVPTFGPGWDMEGYDFNANAPNGTPAGAATWYEAGEPCAPLLQEPVPHLCTYEDANGNLVLCNSLCEACPCTPGMQPLDPLPSGWFWVTTGGNAGCENDCSPGEGWGIGSTTSQINMTMTLTVRDFENETECLQNKDLQISFQTFSDGVAGCWEDPVGECLIDRKQFGPLWEVECMVPPDVYPTPDPEELCFDGITDIDLITADGSTATIIVEVEDNPNVTGEMNHVFPGGAGTINDDLTNNSNTTQIVNYTAYAEVDGLICKGKDTTFQVIIYADLEVTFDPNIYVCDGECIDISPNVSGGTGNYITYIWSTGQSGETIEVCPVVTTTYIVTVTDDLGCSGTGSVEVEVKDPVEFHFLYDELNICKDGIDDNNGDPNNDPLTIQVVVDSGSPDYDVDWSVSPGGLEFDVFGIDFQGDFMIVDEENSDEGIYLITVTVEDLFGCVNTEQITIEVSSGPIVTLNVLGTIPCLGSGVDVFSLTGSGFFPNFPAPDIFSYELVIVEPTGEIQIEYIETAATIFNFVDIELPSGPTTYKLYITDTNGCISEAEILISPEMAVPPEISDAIICLGDTTDLTIVNFSDYAMVEWDNGEMGASISVAPDNDTSYVVTVTDNSGCSAVEAVDVVVNDLPVVDIGDVSFCPGSNATLDAGGDSSWVYSWTLNSTVVGTDSTLVVTDEGIYIVEVSDGNGCMASDSITVTVSTSIMFTVPPQDICDGSTATLNAGVYDEYIWSDVMDGSNVIGNGQTVDVNTGGTYYVTVTDNFGCTGNTSVVVSEFTTPIASVVDTVSACNMENMGIGDTFINFNNQVTGDPGTWVNDDPTNGVVLTDLDSVSFVDVLAGNYLFIFTTNTATAPCENTSDTLVVVVEDCDCPSVDLKEQTLCNSFGTEFDIRELENTNEPGTWQFISGNTPITLDGDTMFITGGIIPGDYIFEFTLDNPVVGCPSSNQQAVTVLGRPWAGIDPDAENTACNADTGNGPTTLDLATLLLTGSEAGTWTQTGGTPVTINGTTIDVDGFDIETLSFCYTTNTAMFPCVDTTVCVNVEIIDCNCPPLSVLPIPTVCNNGDLINLNDYLVTDEPGTWSTQVVPSPLLQDSLFNPMDLLSGEYVVTYTLDNDPGGECPASIDNSVFVVRPPFAELGQGLQPCNEDTGNGDTAINLFDWLTFDSNMGGTWTQTSGSPAIDLSDPQNVEFAGLDVGSVFVFTYTVAGIPPCEDLSLEVTIVVQDCNCPPVVLADPAALCNDGSATLDLTTLEVDVDPGTWSVESGPGALIISGTTLDVIGATPGAYILRYTLDTPPSGNCPPFAEVTLNISELKTAEIVPEGQACTVIDGTGPTIINLNDFILSGYVLGTWSSNDIDVTNFLQVDFEGEPIGQTYTITYTISNDDPCPDQVYTVIITTIDCDCPIINPGFPGIHCTTEGIIDLTAYDDPNQSGSWESSEVTITGNTLDISNLTAGTYTLTYRIDNPEVDCPETEDRTIEIVEPENPGTPEEPFILCVGESQTLDLKDLLIDEDPGGTWMETSTVLSTGGAFNSGAGTFNSQDQIVGTYTFAYILDNNPPCADVMETVVVIIEALPIADAGSDLFLNCDVTSGTLGGASSTGNNITYQWTEASGVVIFDPNNATISVTEGGTYTLVVTDTDTGCSSSDIVTVVKDPSTPSMTVDNTDVTCFGFNDGTITISNPTGGDGNYEYSIDNGATWSTQTSFNGLPPGNYTVILRDGQGCQFPVSVVIIQPELLTISLPQGIKLEPGASEKISIADQLDFDRIVNIVWTKDGEVICSGLENCLEIDATADPVSTYCVIISDANGCMAEACTIITTITVRDVDIPNIFSPDGENDNEFFFVETNASLESIEKMLIYDRWGELIFKKLNGVPGNPTDGWDGTFKQQIVNPGVYVYLIEVKYKDGDDTEVFTGDVTVVR